MWSGIRVDDKRIIYIDGGKNGQFAPRIVMDWFICC